MAQRGRFWCEGGGNLTGIFVRGEKMELLSQPHKTIQFLLYLLFSFSCQSHSLRTTRSAVIDGQGSGTRTGLGRRKGDLDLTSLLWSEAAGAGDSTRRYAKITRGGDAAEGDCGGASVLDGDSFRGTGYAYFNCAPRFSRWCDGYCSAAALGVDSQAQGGCVSQAAGDALNGHGRGSCGCRAARGERQNASGGCGIRAKRRCNAARQTRGGKCDAPREAIYVIYGDGACSMATLGDG